MRDSNKFLVDISMILKLVYNTYENCREKNISEKFIDSETKGTTKCESKKWR